MYAFTKIESEYTINKYELSALWIPEEKIYVMVSLDINESEFWDSDIFLRELHESLIKSDESKDYSKLLKMTDNIIPIEDIPELIEMFNLAINLKML